MDWDTQITALSDMIEGQESQSLEMGRIISEFANEYGNGFLRRALYEKIVDGVYSQTTRKPSIHTFRKLRRVYDKVQEYHIPPDIPYAVVDKLINSKQVDTWVAMIHQGIPYGEILKELKASKEKPVREVRCPSCLKVFAM